MFATRPQTLWPSQEIVGHLRTGELFVVSSLRLWTSCRCAGARAYPDWRQGFLHARIGFAGAMEFDTLCRIVVTTAVRSLDIRPLHCAHLGVDEGRFLRLLERLQHDHAIDAASILSSWCPSSAVRLALPPAQAFAAALRACRLWLPAREADVAMTQATGFPARPPHPSYLH